MRANPKARVRRASPHVLGGRRQSRRHLAPPRGARLAYGLAAGARPGARAIATLAVPADGINTPGESCWPGDNANWRVNPCDHFGVATTSTPGATRYSWLVQAATEGKAPR